MIPASKLPTIHALRCEAHYSSMGRKPMLYRIHAKDLYVAKGNGHVGRFHFAYGDYVDPANGRFGVLDALNDFVVLPGAGFDTHSHAEVEIISYCVQGELSHSDSVGNAAILRRGDVGYQCAGGGITHAEMNQSPGVPLRFVQILIVPNLPRLSAGYRSRHVSAPARRNKWLLVASGGSENRAIQISQDANIFVSEVDAGARLTFVIPHRRQVYLVCIEGRLAINSYELEQRGAIKAIGEGELGLEALEDAHALMVEMARSC
jgi:redox-sensitive bicupin YhaK (pirin superfamily)